MAGRAGMLSANRSDPLNGRIGCVQDEKKGETTGPGASASIGSKRSDEPIDEYADAR